MFTFTQIVVSAVVGLFVSGATAYARSRDLRQSVELAVVVAASILLWRSAANVSALNGDPMPFVSPNDVLCPVVTYVTLGLYAAIRRSDRDAGWPALRAMLTLVSLVVNVVTI